MKTPLLIGTKIMQGFPQGYEDVIGLSHTGIKFLSRMHNNNFLAFWKLIMS